MRWQMEEPRFVMKSVYPSWATAPQRTFDIPKAEVPGYGAEGLAMMKAFAAAVWGEGTTRYTIDDVIAMLRIIEGAHESVRTGRTIIL